MFESPYIEAYTMYSRLKGRDFLKLLPCTAKLPLDIFSPV